MTRQSLAPPRRGAFVVLAFFCLVTTMVFVAFSIDTGNIALNKTLMQNAVDAAALAAAMEITNAVENAPPEVEDPSAWAQEQARAKAVEIAAHNGVFVDAALDIRFGLRSFNTATGKFTIQWDAEPVNAVKIRARKDDDDGGAPDAKLPMMFAGVLGDDSVRMQAEAIAFIESRDIAVVLDFSGSMAYDSLFRDDSISKLGVDAIRDNLRLMYTELQLADGELGTLDHSDPDDSSSARDAEVKWLVVHSPDTGDPADPNVDVTFQLDKALVSADQTYNQVTLRFTNNATQTFNHQATSGTYAGTGANTGRNIAAVSTVFPTGTIQLDDNNANVKAHFQLIGVPYPYPSGSWDGYINYVRSDAEINRGGHREMYGGVTFVHYLLEERPSHAQTPDLCRTSHFPFHAVRKGNELFVDFLDDLGFGDDVGLISYDQFHRFEESLNEDGVAIDLTADPLGDHYAAIKTIMDYKQASHYYARTNIGGGIRRAREMLDEHAREGARPTILLMTDGNANVYENTAGQNHLQSGFTNDGYYQMSGDFDWSLLEYPDGTSFYINDDGSEEARARMYALSQAYKAVEEGAKIHTLAVGAGADRDLMKAIAWLGGGEFISVEGDLSIANLIAEVEDGFFRIAALVPPARLANPDDVVE
jgi:Flp pilus assembly protein TadG